MAEGFLAPRRTSPTTFGIVLLAHAGVLGAVMLAKGPEVLKPPRIIDLIPIHEQAPPPPVPVPPPPTPREQAKRPPDVLDTPTQVVRTDAVATVREIDLPKLPPLPPLPTGDAVVADPPRHVPVETGAIPDPRYAGLFQPAYPSALMRAEVEGAAIVRVLVGADGRVKAVELVSADDPAFAEATRRQALKSWRFRPATRDGVPVESWRTMTVRFRMEA